MSYEKVKQAKQIKVGLKQTKKSVEKGLALEVVLANDADPKILSEISTACQQHQVPITYVDSMSELGQTCGIDVGAACVAIETTRD